MQIDGFVMGYPLGPTLANFFLAQMETQILDLRFQINLFSTYGPWPSSGQQRFFSGSRRINQKESNMYN